MSAPGDGRDPRLAALEDLLAAVDRLRDPGGCPWDRSQTLKGFAPHLIEEAHEFVESVEGGPDSEACGELGDVLLGAFLSGRIASDEGRFSLGQAATSARDKVVRRHPHVFTEVSGIEESGDGDSVEGAPEDAASGVEAWERIKRRERAAQGVDTSALAGVPIALPALGRAHRTLEKAVAAGFRWSDARGALSKVREEVEELRAELESRPERLAGGPPDVAVDDSEVKESSAPGDPVAEELGDLLMATAFLGSYVGIDPEAALRSALRRFEARFRWVEREAGDLRSQSPGQLLGLWERAKGELSAE